MGLYGDNIDLVAENNIYLGLDMLLKESSNDIIITEGVDIKQKLKDLIEKAKTMILKFFRFIREKIKEFVDKIKKKPSPEEVKKTEDDKKEDKPDNVLDKDEVDAEMAKNPKVKEEDKEVTIKYPYVNNILIPDSPVSKMMNIVRKDMDYIYDKYASRDLRHGTRGYRYIDDEMGDKFRKIIKDTISELENKISEYKEKTVNAVDKYIEEFPIKGSYTEDGSNYGFKEVTIKKSEYKKYAHIYAHCDKAVLEATSTINIDNLTKDPSDYFCRFYLGNLEKAVNEIKDTDESGDLVKIYTMIIQAIVFTSTQLKRLYPSVILPYLTDLKKFRDQMWSYMKEYEIKQGMYFINIVLDQYVK